MHLHRSVIALLLLSPCALAQSGIDIRQLMTPAEQLGTGISSLSPAQLEALNQWLQGHVVPVGAGAEPVGQAAVAMAAPDSGVASEQQDSNSGQTAVAAESRAYGEREVFVDIESGIKGPFTGWDGKTVFELENGQVYQQRRQGKWRTSITDPRVRIRKNFLGMFEMEIDGHSIGVKRLR